MMSSDSVQLWNLFLAGDKDAFEQIYRENITHLYEYGMRKVDDEALVRDCIQEIFVKFWDNRKKISTVYNPRQYLLIALKNMLINVALRNNKLTEIGAEEEFLMHFNLEKQLIKDEDDRIRAGKLLKALEQLTAKQKEVIYLRYFEELSYEEIAVVMNITVKGLYKLHYRALDTLKEVLSMPKSEIILLFSFLRFLLF